MDLARLHVRLVGTVAVFVFVNVLRDLRADQVTFECVGDATCQK